MSKNFYLAKAADQVNLLSTEHIGKHSHGWVFTFQGQTCKSKQDWIIRLLMLGQEGFRVFGESGEHYTLAEFWDMVLTTRGAQTNRQSALLQRSTSPDVASSIALDFLSGKMWESDGFDFYNGEFC